MSQVVPSPQRAPSLERIDSQSTFTSFRDKMARALSPNGRAQDGASAPSIGARRPSLGSKSQIHSISDPGTSASREKASTGNQGMPFRGASVMDMIEPPQSPFDGSRFRGASVMDMIERPQSPFDGSHWTRWTWARWGDPDPYKGHDRIS
jgi:hypothetical protein